MGATRTLKQGFMGAILKSSDGVSEIRMRWASTTAPETPFTLPAFVRLDITSEGIRVRAESTSGPSDEDKPDIEFSKDQIVRVDILLMPDSLYADHLNASVGNLSRVVVRHHDPCGVVAFFESTFVSDKSYWVKALSKAIVQRLGIEPQVEGKA